MVDHLGLAWLDLAWLGLRPGAKSWQQHGCAWGRARKKGKSNIWARARQQAYCTQVPNPIAHNFRPRAQDKAKSVSLARF